LETAENALQKRALLYDRGGDNHYDVTSAFIKSIRGSDPDAALYWLARMLEGGEDPLFIARRLVISAAEDIGNADPQALVVANAAAQAVQLIGLPEGRIPLAQAVTYLATAPKSNAAYIGIEKALTDVRKGRAEPVPPHLRDTHYEGAKHLEHGVGYKYPHNYPGHFVPQQYFPSAQTNRHYYFPSDYGFEKEIKKRLQYWQRKKDETQNEGD
jgi:putative ATPase